MPIVPFIISKELKNVPPKVRGYGELLAGLQPVDKVRLSDANNAPGQSPRVDMATNPQGNILLNYVEADKEWVFEIIPKIRQKAHLCLHDVVETTRRLRPDLALHTGGSPERRLPLPQLTLPVTPSAATDTTETDTAVQNDPPLAPGRYASLVRRSIRPTTGGPSSTGPATTASRPFAPKELFASPRQGAIYGYACELLEQSETPQCYKVDALHGIIYGLPNLISDHFGFSDRITYRTLGSLQKLGLIQKGVHGGKGRGKELPWTVWFVQNPPTSDTLSKRPPSAGDRNISTSVETVAVPDIETARELHPAPQADTGTSITTIAEMRIPDDPAAQLKMLQMLETLRQSATANVRAIIENASETTHALAEEYAQAMRALSQIAEKTGEQYGTLRKILDTYGAVIPDEDRAKAEHAIALLNSLRANHRPPDAQHNIPTHDAYAAFVDRYGHEIVDHARWVINCHATGAYKVKNPPASWSTEPDTPSGRMAPKDFVLLAVEQLYGAAAPSVHTVFSGFNNALREYMPDTDPVRLTEDLKTEKIIKLTIVRHGARVTRI